MTVSEVDLLTVDRGHVVAPAGCGKTHLISTALTQHNEPKPILILTHTNAGVSALRRRLNKLEVKPSSYSLLTIDGWAIRLITTFPGRSGHDPSIIEGQRPNYRAIRESASSLLGSGHITDVIKASYARLLVDEYQDCSCRQHTIVKHAADIIPTCVVGDPMQAIFGFGDDPLADWTEEVCAHFPCVGELNTPWRWINSSSESLGSWLLEVRRKFEMGDFVDLSDAPSSVSWVELDGTQTDHEKCLEAGRTSLQGGTGTVLILGESTNPDSQRNFASQTPGAVTVEALDLRDFIAFSQRLNVSRNDALGSILQFTKTLMTGVGVAELIPRIEALTSGTARQEATCVENAALAFKEEKTLVRMRDLLHEISRQEGVRVFRPDVFRGCMQALQICATDSQFTFYEAAIRVREQNRFQGRSLPRRAVGSTLLLKGLEADVAVILNADNMDARNLYVAMTRGAKKLVVCSSSSILWPNM
jgi:DNA helicase-2/ATP-dependent DNA helicase PcrA